MSVSRSFEHSEKKLETSSTEKKAENTYNEKKSEFGVPSESDLLARFAAVFAEEKAYAFLHSRDHFEEKTSTLHFEATGDYHHFEKFKKKYKITGSEERNTSGWMEISSEMHDPKHAEYLYRLIVLIGDIYRFDYGNLAPKYRIDYYPNGTFKLLTKIEPGCIEPDFFDYVVKHFFPHGPVMSNPYQDEKTFEGLGTSTTLAYIYRNDDFNFGNLLPVKVGNHVIFIPIDHDRSLWPLPDEFFSAKGKNDRPLQATKELRYESEYPGATVKRRPKKEGSSILKTHTFADMGTQNEEDYCRLPLIRHRIPTIWQFMYRSIKPYVVAASQSEVVENEVSYQRLKTCLTSFTKKLLVEYHLGREGRFADLKTKVSTLVQSEIATAESICRDSARIHNYLNKYRLQVFQAILFELNASFYDNKHYMPKDKAVWGQLWADVVDLTLAKFNSMLSAQQLDILSLQEVIQLKQFAVAANNNEPETCAQTAKFFQEQQRFAHATAITTRFYKSHEKRTSLFNTAAAAPDRKEKEPADRMDLEPPKSNFIRQQTLD